MKKMLIIALILIVSMCAYAEPTEQLSVTKFNSAEAKKVQEQYNAAVREAWDEFLKKVAVAQQQYVKELEPLKEQLAAQEKYQEAAAVKKEIGQYTIDLAEGLVLHMDFENVRMKQVPDLSPAGNHGRLIGGNIVDGKFGKALQCKFERKNDGVRIKDNPSLDMKEVTICAWIKSDRIDKNWNRILDKDWRSGYNLCIGGDWNNKKFRNKLVFEVSSGGKTSVSPVVDGKWHFLGGVFGDNTYKLYVDGKLDFSEIRGNKAPIKTNNNDVIIGNNGGAYDPPEQNHFDGLIDEVRLYNRPLNDREIKAIYQSQP